MIDWERDGDWGEADTEESEIKRLILGFTFKGSADENKKKLMNIRLTEWMCHSMLSTTKWLYIIHYEITIRALFSRFLHNKLKATSFFTLFFASFFARFTHRSWRPLGSVGGRIWPHRPGRSKKSDGIASGQTLPGTAAWPPPRALRNWFLLSFFGGKNNCKIINLLATWNDKSFLRYDSEWLD